MIRKQKHTKAALAKALGVSRASLYYVSKHLSKDWKLKMEIEAVLSENPAYGSPRVALALHRNRKPVQRVMKLFGMKAYRRRGRKFRKSGVAKQSYPNILKTYVPKGPGDVWVADFTYVPFQGKFLYLATVMDIVTRESLYAFNGNYAFVNDFKKRADTYDPNLGLVYATSDPEHKGEHLDQELLICDTTGDGEPAAFSRYGMSVGIISSITKSQTLFEEFKIDGKPFLKFKDDHTAEIFAERRQAIIDGYAALLGFERVFKNLTPIYETDMTDNVANKLAALRDHIESHNNAVRIATNTDDASKTKKNWILRQRESTPFENNLLIDVSSIEPDPKIIEEYEAKIKEVFPDASLN